MNNLYIKTYGCQMNKYDSSRIADLLKENLDTIRVDTPEEADIILIITCSVREKPEEKVFSDLGRYRKIKNEKPDLIIGVGGCVASQHGKEILRRAPYVNVVFGPQTLHRLPALIEEAKDLNKSVIDISFPEIEKFDQFPQPKIEGPTGAVTIMEGCNNYCSYCIVPYVRGKEISRPFDGIIKEIKTLTEQGVCEITLLGQNVNHYQDKTNNLTHLIREVADIEKIKRIRFVTSHPAYFFDELIDVYKNTPKLANHLHLPAQSGSDRILMMMKRRYTSDEYRDLVRRLREARPGLNISSDFIVGFPDETDRDFEATLKLIEDIQFDHSFSFMYSPRPGTAASHTDDSIPLTVKKERLKRLQVALKKQEMLVSKALLGSTQPVLVTGHTNGQAHGITDNNRTVYFIGEEYLIGQLIAIKITDISSHSLKGEIVE